MAQEIISKKIFCLIKKATADLEKPENTVVYSYRPSMHYPYFFLNIAYFSAWNKRSNFDNCWWLAYFISINQIIFHIVIKNT